MNRVGFCATIYADHFLFPNKIEHFVEFQLVCLMYLVFGLIKFYSGDTCIFTLNFKYSLYFLFIVLLLRSVLLRAAKKISACDDFEEFASVVFAKALKAALQTRRGRTNLKQGRSSFNVLFDI